MQKGRDWIFSSSEMIRLFLKGLAWVRTVTESSTARPGPFPTPPPPLCPPLLHLSGGTPVDKSVMERVEKRRSRAVERGGNGAGTAGTGAREGWRQQRDEDPQTWPCLQVAAQTAHSSMAFAGNPTRVGCVPGAAWTLHRHRLNLQHAARS